MTEQWVHIIGYEDLYSISNKGNIFSHYTNKRRAINNSGVNKRPIMYIV